MHDHGEAAKLKRKLHNLQLGQGNRGGQRSPKLQQRALMASDALSVSMAQASVCSPAGRSCAGCQDEVSLEELAWWCLPLLANLGSFSCLSSSSGRMVEHMHCMNLARQWRSCSCMNDVLVKRGWASLCSVTYICCRLISDSARMVRSGEPDEEDEL